MPPLGSLNIPQNISNFSATREQLLRHTFIQCFMCKYQVRRGSSVATSLGGNSFVLRDHGMVRVRMNDDKHNVGYAVQLDQMSACGATISRHPSSLLSRIPSKQCILHCVWHCSLYPKHPMISAEGSCHLTMQQEMSTRRLIFHT